MRIARVCVPVACGALVSLAFALPAGAALDDGPWIMPVDGRIVRVFDPPESRFGPGHLGVDFAAAPNTPVRAAGDGVVAFAGRVGAGLHVVVRHAGDIRTSSSFVASLDAVKGQAVERGDIIGTTGGTGSGHGPGVLHFGVRLGANYIDPMLLFAPVDLAAVVHLAAPRGGPVGLASVGERAALAAALRVGARRPVAPPAWWAEAGAAPPSRRDASASPRHRFGRARPWGRF